MTFTARTDRRFIRSTYRSNRFVLAEIDAPAGPPRARSVRRSISPSSSTAPARWAASKIRLAKLAVEESIARLHADDRFAIVVYDDQIDVVFPSTLGHARGPPRRPRPARRDRRPRQHEPRRRLAARLRAGRAGPLGRRASTGPCC